LGSEPALNALLFARDRPEPMIARKCPMLARTSIAAIALLVATSHAHSAEDAKAYHCTFNSGIAHIYEKGEFAQEKGAPLAFGIAAINPQAQTADLTTERGTGSLKIVQAVNALHFLEVVTEGWLHITTVFDKDDAKGVYPAVHSRHFGLFGQPIVTQYQGFCAAKG
jgi:hypothetical protein